MRFNGPVFLNNSRHTLGLKLNAESRMVLSAFGVRRLSTHAFSHLRSLPKNGGVIKWSDVADSDRSPTCMSLSHNPIQGHSCVLAAADHAGVVAVFDPTAGARRLHDFCFDVQPHVNTVHDLKWACDDSFIASASADGSVVINSFAEYRLVPLFALSSKTTEFPYVPPVKSVACHPSTSTLLASGTRHGTLCLWDTRAPETPISSNVGHFPDCVPHFLPPLRSLHHPFPSEARSMTGVEFLSDNSLMTCCADGSVCLWDLRNFSEPFVAQEASNSKMRALCCVRLSPCRTRVAFASALGSCFVQTLPCLDSDGSCTAIPITPHRELNFGSRLDWSPCGRFIACGSRDKAIHIVDMQSGAVVLKLMGHSRSVTDVVWLKHRTGLLSLSKDRQVRVWNPTMQAPRARQDAA
jgi:WD40 repeat protein